MDNKEEYGKKKSKKKLVLILGILGIIMLAGGSVLSYFTSKTYVATTVVKNMTENAVQVMAQGQETGLEDNYKTVSNVKINLQSDYYQSLASMDPSYATIANLFRNLSNTDSNITTVQDKENKRLFVSVDTTLQAQPLMNMKYLVEDATEYYYIDGVSSTYINNGNNNYFESLNSTTTTNENITYIIEKIGESVSNNLKEEYLTESYEGEYKEITITLTEDNLVELINNVLDDLKEDSKANQIMTGYNQDFANQRVTKEQVSGLGTIRLHIYINKIYGAIERYELELGDETSLVYYQESDKNILELIESNETTARLEITTQGEKTDIVITDGNGTNLGTISISKTSTNQDIIVNITEADTSLDITYNKQLTNLQKGTSYDSTTTMSIKIASSNMTLIDGTITITSTTTNDTTISEDVSNSVLASTMTGTEQELLNQKLTTVFTQLMS